MGKTIGLISIKGGVGKTTISAALAVDLANAFSKRVLLVDTNYSAPNLGIHMDIISPGKTVHDVLSGGSRISHAVHEVYGVHVVPGNFLFRRDYSPLKLRNKLASVKKNYDFIILDSSPCMNDEILSTMLASDSLFVVSTPDYPTLSCSMKAARLAKQRNKPVDGIILNRVRGKYEVRLGEIQESVGIPVIARIREDNVVRLALHERVPAPLFAKGSKFSKEIRKLSSVLVGRKERRGFWRAAMGKDFRKEQVNREVLRQDFYKSMFSR